MKKSLLAKILSIFLATVLSLTLFTACGKEDDDKTVIDKNQVDGKYNITIAAQAEDGEQAILQALKKGYETLHPEVNIIIRNFAGKTYTEIMQTWAKDNKQLPMISWMDDRDFAAYAKGGYYVDLRPYYEKDLAATDYNLYYQSMLDSAAYNGEYRPTTSYSGTVEGKQKSDDREHGLYFAPRDYNEIALVYNKTKFEQYHIFEEYEEKYGVDLSNPAVNCDKSKWNWDAFINLIHLAGENILEYNLEPGAFNERVVYLHNSYEPVYTSVFEELGSDGLIKDGQINISSEANKAVYKELHDEIYAYETKYEENGVEKSIKNMLSREEVSFNVGLNLMTVCARPTVYGFYNSLKAMGQEVDVLPFPTQKIAAGCSGYGITTYWAEEEQTANGVTKKNKDICWDFIKYVITEQGQEVAGVTGVSSPVLKSLQQTGTWRTALSATLNHDAFIQPEELRQATYLCFPAERNIRTSLRSILTNFLMEMELTESGKAGDPSMLSNTLANYTGQFNDVIKSIS